MSWLELSVVVQKDSLARVEAALEDLGALSVTLLDAEDVPILEPAAGETPVWPNVVVNALFEATVDRGGLFDALQLMVAWLTPERVSFRDVADADWTRAWMDQFKPMAFGRRTFIYPWNIEPPDQPDQVVIRLDPGLAFGTGTHATTALCLHWLDGLALSGRRVIDFGCGSGILAIAALKLGAAEAIGIDNDPQALLASHDNAERNGVLDHLHLYTPENAPVLSADVVVANILASALIALEATLAALCRPGALIALSGILRGQEGEVMAAFAADFSELEVVQQEDWVRITGRRRSAG
ncbi:MAG: 50S ribosomal protein L11 methyltransferase [Lysobacterales bacterium CG02_land_8_20_14_3_00_62_12]|nr:MAG: 50S ribosomal protein L11 methyltransferase [Xanthomonadales bacterium CG02_land_8_20_14_3_00_62_12]